ELAKAGDARAEAYLRASLRKDEDFHVRAHAAEVAGRVPAVGADLVAAIDDPEVRVRSAAIEALADAPAQGGPPPPGPSAAPGRPGGGPRRPRASRPRWSAAAPPTPGPSCAQVPRARSARCPPTRRSIARSPRPSPTQRRTSAGAPSTAWAPTTRPPTPSRS